MAVSREDGMVESYLFRRKSGSDGGHGTVPTLGQPVQGFARDGLQAAPEMAENEGGG